MIRRPLTIQAVAELIGATVEGDAARLVSGLAPIASAGPEDLTFADEKHAAQLAHSGAGAAIVGRETKTAAMTLLRVDNVQAAVARLLAEFSQGEDLPAQGVHPSAIVAADASVGEDVAIGPGAVVGSGAVIGDRCVLCANVTIGSEVRIDSDTVLFEGVVIRHGCSVGKRVRIGPNSVIGFEGFGYYFDGQAHRRVPHAGSVIIEDDVELGACTCVDRGKFDPTVIGAGAKVDNLVQIAHNVRIGPRSLLAAQVGLAGSSRLGSGVVMGGASGVRDNVTVGDGVQCAAFSAIAADVQPGQIVAGTPAGPAREKLRAIQLVDKLPEKLKEIAARISQIEARLEGLAKAPPADTKQV